MERKEGQLLRSRSPRVSTRLSNVTHGNVAIHQHIGNYRIITAIARGGYGNVYLGKHIILTRRIVAIKLLRTEYITVKEERERFFREAKILEQLKHPYILPLLDVGIHQGLPYIVVKYAPQGSLQDLLENLFPQLLTQEEAIEILTQIGEGLHFAHQQGIVHCDLKPSNILFNARGEAVIADFGIAAIVGRENGGFASVAAGSRVYMSPEHFAGRVSKASDQYSLGCIAYLLFTGRLPFRAQDGAYLKYMHLYQKPIPLTQLNPRLSPHIERAVLKAMAKQPEERFKDIPSFIAALYPPVSQTNTSSLRRVQIKQLLNAGDYYYRVEQYSKALVAYNRAIELDPGLAVAHNGRGNALYSLGRYGGALVAYNRAIELDPGLAVAHNGRGCVLYSLGRYKEALAVYKRALRIDPHLSAAYYNHHLTFERLDCQKR